MIAAGVRTCIRPHSTSLVWTGRMLNGKARPRTLLSHVGRPQVLEVIESVQGERPRHPPAPMQDPPPVLVCQ
jgi:hypothetical protein